MQRRVVELELFQTVAQAFVLVGFGGIQAGKHLRLNFLEPGQGLGRREGRTARPGLDQRDGVTHFGRLQLANASNDVTHFTRLQRVARLIAGGEHAEVVRVVSGACGHHLESLAFSQTTINHAHQHDNTHIGVKPTVHNHGPQRAGGTALGWRNSRHHGLKDVVNAHARLGRTRNGIGRVNANHIFNFSFGVLWVGIGQVHLVQNGDDLNPQLQGGVAVGDGLRLNPLARIDDKQGPFAG